MTSWPCSGKALVLMELHLWKEPRLLEPVPPHHQLPEFCRGPPTSGTCCPDLAHGRGVEHALLRCCWLAVCFCCWRLMGRLFRFDRAEAGWGSRCCFFCWSWSCWAGNMPTRWASAGRGRPGPRPTVRCKCATCSQGNDHCHSPDKPRPQYHRNTYRSYIRRFPAQQNTPRKDWMEQRLKLLTTPLLRPLAHPDVDARPAHAQE